MTNDAIADFEVTSSRDAGYVKIVGFVPALSLQSSKTRKQPYMVAIREALANATDFVLMGDVKVTIAVYTDYWVRYRTNRVADIDNIVKPLLDSISGKNGVLVDDGQVQGIDVSWQDKSGVPFDFTFTLEPLSALDSIMSREHLRFAEHTAAKCYPISTEWSPEVLDLMLTAQANSVSVVDGLVGMGIAEDVAHWHSTIQRSFPSSRIRPAGYPVIPVKKLYKEIGKEVRPETTFAQMQRMERDKQLPPSP